MRAHSSPILPPHIEQQLFAPCPKPPKSVSDDHRFDSYIALLKSAGVEINHKLECGTFELKNGLTYPGLYIKQAVKGPQNLVVVPVQLLLTSHRAEIQSPELAQIFENEEFYHSGPLWQDRILITYILYLLSKRGSSQSHDGIVKVWTEMAVNFSKEIDILSMWQDEELKGFKDKSIVNAVEMERKNFSREWEAFNQIRDQYPLLQSQFFSKQNYAWIYTHAVSRCFGSFMNSTYFVPFCEFFNHSCVDVSYSCHEDSPEPEQNQHDGKKADEDDGSLSDVTDISGDSIDFIEDGDFSYEEVHSYTIKWGSKVSFSLLPKQTKKLEQKQAFLFHYLQHQLIWSGFSLLYIGEIIEKGNLIVSEYMAGRKKFQTAMEDLQILIYHSASYRAKVKRYFKLLGCSYNKGGAIVISDKQKEGIRESKEQGKNMQQSSSNYNKSHKPPDKDYKYFAMQAHQSADFEPNREIYFQYGRLSNRALLIRYGFCLEDNIYEHVWIRKSLCKEIAQYPDLFARIKEKALPITYQIKLKPYVLNIELITLKKMWDWKLYVGQDSSSKDFDYIFGITDIQKQIAIIREVLEQYMTVLAKYSGESGQNLCSSEGEWWRIYQSHVVDLSKADGYHGYFQAVYNNSKLKIIMKQIHLLHKVDQILNKYCSLYLKEPTNSQQNMKKTMREVLPNRRMRKMVWGYLRNISPFCH